MRTPKSFEEGMERLNTLLAQMQSEDTTLADSVKLYAEAASLMEYCHAALEKTSLQIDEIDAQLISMMATRMKVAREIGRVKRDSNMPILQSSRWEDVLGRSVAEGVKQGMSGEFVRRIFEAVHQESIEQQNAVMSEKQ